MTDSATLAGPARSLRGRLRALTRYRYRAAYSLAVLGTLIVVFFMHLAANIDGYYRAMFSDMVYGTAHRPFVYRALVPTAIRLITQAVPAPVREALVQQAGPLGVELLAGKIAIFLGLVGFYFAFRWLFKGLYRAPGRACDGLSLLALLCLPPLFTHYSYLYDTATLFLFTLGLGLLVRRRWAAFLLLYPVACLNKETTLLLTLVFAIHFASRERLARSRYFNLLLVQAILFILIRMELLLAFGSNPGNVVEFHLLDHNLALVAPYPFTTVLAWAVLLWLLFEGWREKPLFLRHSLWIAVPLLGLTLFLGYLDEWRDYYELFPVLMLLAAPTLGRLLKIEIGPAAE